MMFFHKKAEKHVVELTSAEVQLLRYALIRFRNKCLQSGKPTEDINGLLLMILK